MQPQGAPDQLPPGWTSEWSAQYQRYYYVSVNTGESTWTTPALPPPPVTRKPIAAPIPQTSPQLYGQVAQQNPLVSTGQNQYQPSHGTEPQYSQQGSAISQQQTEYQIRSQGPQQFTPPQSAGLPEQQDVYHPAGQQSIGYFPPPPQKVQQSTPSPSPQYQVSPPVSNHAGPQQQFVPPPSSQQYAQAVQPTTTYFPPPPQRPQQPTPSQAPQIQATPPLPGRPVSQMISPPPTPQQQGHFSQPSQQHQLQSQFSGPSGPGTYPLTPQQQHYQQYNPGQPQNPNQQYLPAQQNVYPAPPSQQSHGPAKPHSNTDALLSMSKLSLSKLSNAASKYNPLQPPKSSNAQHNPSIRNDVSQPASMGQVPYGQGQAHARTQSAVAPIPAPNVQYNPNIKNAAPVTVPTKSSSANFKKWGTRAAIGLGAIGAVALGADVLSGGLFDSASAFSGTGGMESAFAGGDFTGGGDFGGGGDLGGGGDFGGGGDLGGGGGDAVGSGDYGATSDQEALAATQARLEMEAMGQQNSSMYLDPVGTTYTVVESNSLI